MLLSWGCSGIRFSFPYELRIDGVSVATSRVQIRNWPVVVIIIMVVWVILFGMIGYLIRTAGT